MAQAAARLDPGWRAHVEPAWLAGWEPRAFDLGDGVTEVVVLGSGPPLLLLPPLPGWKEAWVACAWRLAATFRVVTFDLVPRRGAVDPWATWVADTMRVADAFTRGRVAIAGHSLGGALAQHVAFEHPSRVRALVLSSTFARVTTPRGALGRRFLVQPLVLASQRWLPDPLAAPLARRLAARTAWVYDRRCDERTLAFVRFGIRHASPLQVAGMLRAAFAHDTRAVLPRVAAPARVLVGGVEPPFIRDAARELTELLPHAELETLPGVGHLHPLSAPAELADAIAGWVSREWDGGRPGMVADPAAT
jgi:pimeloyl-ACP methyl ester carboxylesterase